VFHAKLKDYIVSSKLGILKKNYKTTPIYQETFFNRKKLYYNNHTVYAAHLCNVS